MTTFATPVGAQTGTMTMQDPAIKQLIQRLRQTDNFTNFFYLVRVWTYFALVASSTIGFYYANAYWGGSWAWNVPVTILGVFLMGAGMHQLTALTHEASHFILFKNRWMNELISEFFCMYPVYGSTHLYRLQHIAHHQFVNDPERDPDLAQIHASGHFIGNPAKSGAFKRLLYKQLWLPNVLRFMFVRARFNAVGTDHNPYRRKGTKTSKAPGNLGLGYFFSLMGVLAVGVLYPVPWLLWAGPLVLSALLVIGISMLRPDQFMVTRVQTVFPAKYQMGLRVLQNGALYTGLAYLSVYVDRWAPVYYAVLWLSAIFTSFSLFMMLRQVVQHGNADRGWLTNTRTFIVSEFIRFAVFPLGQDYHLPHHLYASVPHYNLRELHEGLMQCPEYAAEATEVHGYFASPESPKVNPTVMDVLSPEWAPKKEHEIHLDHSVLDSMDIQGREEIIADAERAKAGK